MSYQKLKEIRVDKHNMRVVFMEKCNNDTEPFKHGDATIPFFVHSCWGNIYQHSDKKINSIITQMKSNFKSLEVDESDVWWTFETAIQNDDIHSIREDLRKVFFETCDKINNLK